ncbi:MAG: hypothetical protein U9Q69_00365 [Nanoarchaeota archaeon]|nr:hypothetical protein [Nanoarchaeota archaeon]
MVEGSEVNEPEIRRLAVLECFEDKAEIIYSGELNAIYQAGIDLKRRKLTDKRILAPNLSEEVNALNIIRSPNMHERLIQYGKRLKI